MKALSPVMPITLASLLLLGAAQAQDSGVSNLSVRNKTEEPVMQTVNVLENEMIGRIDWENKVVYAVGDGVPPIDAVNPAQPRVRAKRAAIDETIARLPGTIKEVKVDAESTTRNFINEGCIVRTWVSGLIKNAVIVEQRQISEGSYQIMMSMPMIEPEGLNASLIPAQIVQIQQVRIASRTTFADSSPPPAPLPNAASETQPVIVKPASWSALVPGPAAGNEPAAVPKPAPYTGLIVDARGLNPSPAAFPKLLSQAGDVLCDLTILDPNAATERGMCDYKKSLEVARQPPRTGHNPLVVKAVVTSGTNKTNLVLDEETAKQVKAAESGASFLRNAQVAAVVE